MMRVFFFLCIACCCYLQGLAQKNVLRWEHKDWCPSAYRLSEVSVLDQRGDTAALMGFIQQGLRNYKTRLKSQPSLPQALEQLYLNTVSKDGPGYRLLLLLQNFYAWEKTGPLAMAERGFFYYKADYFMAAGNGPYYLAAAIDTVIEVMGVEVTDRLLHTMEQSLCLLYTAMSYADTGKAYTYEEAAGYDSLCKNTVPAYYNPIPGNAVYTTWADFKKLEARKDYTIVQDGKKFRIQYENDNGRDKSAPVSYCRVFAFEGQLYYSHNTGCWPMYRRGNDFFTEADEDLLGHEAVANNRYRSETQSHKTRVYKIEIRSGELIPVK